MSTRHADEASQPALASLSASYHTKGRSGVAELPQRVEGYFVAPGKLSAKLLAAAAEAAAAAEVSGTMSHLASRVPKHVEEGQLLLVMIHRKVDTHSY